MKVKHRFAIVTGASSGIGLATARLLTKEGARVALVARSADKLEHLSTELPGSTYVAADMSRSFEVRRMVAEVRERFGRVDILVNSAGQGYDALVERTDLDVLRYIFELELVGPLVAMQEVVPVMREQGSGAIVNVSSGTALMTTPNSGAYSSIKGALTRLSLTARDELRDDNITVGVVYPYITLTNFDRRTIRGPRRLGEGKAMPPPDTASHVAKRVVEAIDSGAAETFAHDWMAR